MWKLILSFTVGFILCFLLLRQCNGPEILPKASRTVEVDTVYVPGDSVRIVKTITKNYPIYVRVASDSLKQGQFCDSIRLYRNILNPDTNTSIIVSDSIIGKLLWSDIKYLNRPYTRQITTTITDSIPYAVKTFKHGIYIKGELGMSKANYNLSAGIDYISKKNWSVGYRRDFLQKSHNLSLGYRISK